MERETEIPEGKKGVEPDAQQRVDAVVLLIARLIGRQMAREDFERLAGVNDNQDDDLP